MSESAIYSKRSDCAPATLATSGNAGLRLALSLLALLWAGPGNAGTIVAVQTSLGDFYIEVDEESAPITAGNFLNYVTSGRYNNTFIHSVSGGSIIHGGGYQFNDCNDGPESISLDAPLPLEDTGLSNLNGTIAAWHPSTDPEGATSQWFINIGNDPTLDSLNGGYAVFGRVLGDGISVASRIARGNPVRLGFFEETPAINYQETTVDCQQFSRDNLVQVYMSVVDDNQSAATALYELTSQTLRVNVDLGRDGFQQINFEVDASATQASIIARPETARRLSTPEPNMASYNRISGILTLPSIAVDGKIVYRNLEFELVDPAVNRFILRSSN